MAELTLFHKDAIDIAYNITSLTEGTPLVLLENSLDFFSSKITHFDDETKLKFQPFVSIHALLISYEITSIPSVKEVAIPDYATELVARAAVNDMTWGKESSRFHVKMLRKKSPSSAWEAVGLTALHATHSTGFMQKSISDYFSPQPCFFVGQGASIGVQIEDASFGLPDSTKDNIVIHGDGLLEINVFQDGSDGNNGNEGTRKVDPHQLMFAHHFG
ncbi:MAG: hypothetical protein F6K31_09805 [Symploca sp. SIO2G7]|nr:hypothetical protein [Symploca sp. SIO2G7]